MKQHQVKTIRRSPSTDPRMDGVTAHIKYLRKVSDIAPIGPLDISVQCIHGMNIQPVNAEVK